MSKKTVLIVDDTFENLYLLRVILEEAGFIVIEATNGEEGLNQLHDNSNVDLIISDILMPIMDGYLFCKACKNEKLFKDIPFVFYTSTYTEKLDEDFGLKLGASHFLRKPIDHDELLYFVNDIFNSEKPQVKNVKKAKVTEGEALKLYSERLINKLEQKSIDLGHEVNERKKAEQLLIHKNEILDLIAVNTPLNKIFDKLLLNYESIHPDYFGAIRLMDVDGMHLNLESAPSMPKDFYLVVKKIPVNKDASSCGAAAFTKKPVIVSDIGSDALCNEFKEISLKHNLKSCWSIPILSKDDDVLGTFSIYSKSIRTPSIEEIRELNFAVSLVNIAIEKFRTTEEIRKKDESYRALIDQANDAIMTYALDGTIYSFNKATYINFGYTEEEFSKFKIQDIIVGEIIQDQDNLKKMLDGEAIVFTRQFAHKNKSIVELEISSKVQNDGKILGIARDVTERKKAELELKRAKEFTGGLIESMQDGLSVIDVNKKHIHVNPALCKITGYSEEELLGIEPPFPYWPPEYYDEINDIVKNTLLGIDKSGESVFKRKNGERFPVHMSISRVKDNQGNDVAFFATIQDISAKVKAREELRAAKEFSDKLIMSMQEGLIIVNLEGEILMVNDSTCNILQYTEKELVGLNLPYPFAHTEDFEEIAKTNQQVAAGKAPTFQFEFIRKNGEKFQASFLTGNIKNDKGEVIALFGTMKDLSEENKARKLLEDNAKKSLERKNVILELASLVGTDFNVALNNITALSAHTLNVDRVCVIKFNTDQTELIFEKSYTKKNKNFDSGLVVPKKLGEEFFNAIAQNKTVNAPDALTNKYTKGFADMYLLPLNIKSKLSIPIQGVNQVYGVLCIEQVENPRIWTSEEEEFATSIANLVSLMIESSERKAVEKELISEKEFSEELITSLHEGLSVVDLEGKHIKVNAALCKMTGFTEAELLGERAPFSYWPPEEYDKVYEAFNNPLKAIGKSKTFTLMRKNGERFPVSLSDAVIKNNEGEIIAYFSTIIDISLRVKAEQVLLENIRIADERKSIIIELASLIGEEFNDSLKKIVTTTAKALNVDLVTIWEYQNNYTELLSKLFYVPATNTFDVDGLRIKKEQIPNYFKAFNSKNTINIPDVVDNPITKDLAKDYFEPNNIFSRIDVLIYGRKAHYGILSFESSTPNRVFTHEEESFVTSIASIVSLMVESSDRKLAEKEALMANEQLSIANKELNELRNQLEQENVYLRNEIDLVFNYEEMVYGSEEFSNVLTEVEKVAPTNATVLLLGESGTGKELLARAVHNTSLRNKKPLIKVNCSAIPRELIESELFGHKKGSFTGAIADKVGKFELADGGTLFLDEIGELPLDMQPKILRFLQEGEIEVVGGTGMKKLDVRVIAATNRNLKEEIEKKQFREDLYFRLNVFPIVVPPLRTRKDDIPLLVEHFVDKFNKAYTKSIKFISDDAMSQLKAYEWPGNIRELENLIERASILSTNETLLIPGFESKGQKSKSSINSKNLSLDYAQRNHILQVLEQCSWKISGDNGAAFLLDLKPSTLRDKMAKLDITKP